jgi:hypothetical protein
MKAINWLVGVVGIASLITALFIHSSQEERIQMLSGVSYYHESDNGYGIVTTVKPSQYDPQYDVSTYEFIIFDGSIDNANSFFSPIVIHADEDSALIRIDSPTGSKSGVFVYHTRKESDSSFIRISNTNDDVKIEYVDTTGDFLPNVRITKAQGRDAKRETIEYTFKEIEVEQSAPSNH